jgi:phosphogluconate dehydratase
VDKTVGQVTEQIRRRSRDSRRRYLERIDRARRAGPDRSELPCGNLAHAFAACESDVKAAYKSDDRPNLAIVSAYNDMLSAHQPLQEFPAVIKNAAWKAGGMAQFAGGVPAMCDGVTQGQAGMELSLFSRDVIAMATAVALSHNTFDGALCLGVCDKIVPGLLIGALSFGHLPTVFIPAGPMVSGLSNMEKAKTRQAYAEGKIGRQELLEAESKSYHSAGTCTFYGTANSNQLLMEFMGLQLPGASFVNPHTPLRLALTRAAAARAVAISRRGGEYTPLAEVLDEKALVNGMVGLLASGGSTNHTIHLVAIGRAAGIHINWEDFDRLSSAVPLLARVYPNGTADVNHFQAAGGIGFMVRELLQAGLLHPDVRTIAGDGLAHYQREPFLEGEDVSWKDGPQRSLDRAVLREYAEPFDRTGGLRLLEGRLGRAVIKVSAVDSSRHRIEAPARVFASQDAVIEAFKAGEFTGDTVVVVINQGPRANGMPELHKLTPALGVLQDRGLRVALVTDGRMSGASGKVPAAIQLSPESACGGPLARVRDGDVICLDAAAGTLDLRVDEEEFAGRAPNIGPGDTNDSGMGRELFGLFRRNALSAEEGGSPIQGDEARPL